MQIAEADTWANHGSGKTFSTTSGSTNTIDSAGDLAQLAINVNAGTSYSGVTFKQTVNIKLGKYDWVPIGTSSHGFYGNYDGQNYKIDGLIINTTEDNQGLFGYVRGPSSSNMGEINNVFLQSGIISGGRYVGGIIGYVNRYVNISNCKNNVSICGSLYVGGIAAYLYDNSSNITNCFNSGNITGIYDESGNRISVGGIAGRGCGSKCVNEGDVTATSNNAIALYNVNVGGLFGLAMGRVSSSTSCCTINCLTDDNDGVGGLVGMCNSTVTGCAAYGHINYTGSASLDHVGGLLGYLTIGYDIYGCSYIGSSNIDINLCGDYTSTRLKACYIYCNDVGQLSSEIDNIWTSYLTVVPNMNDGLPIQRDLYSIASAIRSTIDELQTAFRNHGFSV